MATGKSADPTPVAAWKPYTPAATVQRHDPYGDEIIGLVNARKQHAVNYYQKYFLKLARWYDLWRGIYTTRFDPYRNNVHLPLLFAVVQSDVARKVQTSFGSWPVVTFGGYAPEDAPRARKNEILISAQMKDADSFRKAVDLFVTADLYGTGIARLGWRKDVRYERLRVLDPVRRSESVSQHLVTRFDGPDWSNVDPLDFWGQPGRSRICDMDWMIHRYYEEFEVLKEKAQPTDDGRQPLFEMSQINKLASAPIQGDQPAEMVWRMSVYRSFGEWEARNREQYAKPVEIWEMWGRVPEEFAPDGFVHRRIIVANGRVVLRNEPNPYWHGRNPFYDYSPCPDPHYFHGVGKVEIGEKMQAAATRLANQKLDALDLFGSPTFFVDRSLGIDTSNLYLRPGRVIGTNKPPTDEMIRPMQPDLRGLQQTYAEIAQLWQMIQTGTGLQEDTVMGGPGNRQTAREFLGRQENVLTRLMLEARLAEEGVVEPLANGMVDLNKQFLQVPHEIKIIGSVSMVNSVTGLPYPQDMTSVDLEDLNHNWHAHAIGATQMLGKNVRQQNLMMALQAVSQNPIAIKMVNWAAFFRQFFMALDLTNLDELLVQQVPMINMMADETQMPPEQLAQMLSQQPLSQMDPEQLGAITGMQPEAALPNAGPMQAYQMGG